MISYMHYKTKVLCLKKYTFCIFVLFKNLLVYLRKWNEKAVFLALKIQLHLQRCSVKVNVESRGNSNIPLSIPCKMKHTSDRLATYDCNLILLRSRKKQETFFLSCRSRIDLI